MPKIIPIKELKNTSEISDLCHKTNEPIFITIITLSIPGSGYPQSAMGYRQNGG